VKIGEDGRERGIGDGARRPQRSDLGVVLDRSQAFDDSAVRHECEAVGLGLEPIESGDRDVVGLDADPGDLLPSRPADQVRPDGAGVDRVDVGHLTGRLGEVAPVSGEHRTAVPGDEGRGVRPGEPGEVADVEQIRDQQGVDVGRQPLGKGGSAGRRDRHA
jgi:hypothetical protein